MTLGQRILNARRARGMGQKELATVLGVSTKTVSNWERDAVAPQPSGLRQLQEILGVDLSVDPNPDPEANQLSDGALIETLASRLARSAAPIAAVIARIDADSSLDRDQKQILIRYLREETRHAG